MKQLIISLLALSFILLGCPSLPAQEATVTFTWTAVADDGSDPASGPAAKYEFRLYSDSLHLGNWFSGTQILNNVPIPGLPGATDSLIVTFPNDTTLWIAARVWDDAVYPNGANVSDVSNSIKVKWDVTAPSTIQLFIKSLK